jgi:DNA replication protein DnaC
MSKVNFIQSLTKLRKKVVSEDFIKNNELELKKEKLEQEKIRKREEKIVRDSFFYTSGVSATTLPLSRVIAKTKEQAPIYEYLKNVNLEKNYKLPYLFGPKGCGKSHAARSFAVSMINKYRKGVYFVRLSRLFINYRSLSFEAKAEELKKLCETFIIILDDFCLHSISKLVIEVLHATLDYRLEHNKPTFVTSNVAPNDIKNVLMRAGKKNGVEPFMCDSIEDRLIALCRPTMLKGQSVREMTAKKEFIERSNKTSLHKPN